jgi:hypothetical protein
MTEYWEQWVGSTARPVERIKQRAKVTKRDGRKWITFPDEIGRAAKKSWSKCPRMRRRNRATTAATTTARIGLARRNKAG